MRIILWMRSRAQLSELVMDRDLWIRSQAQFSGFVVKKLNTADDIDGIIVTTPIPDGRVKLGAQVVQLLVQHGFVGPDKWKKELGIDNI